MADAPSPRPFKTLGALPFLHADAAALALIQSEFHKRSRQFHPDRFINASDATRAEAESKSAELNSDYATLRDRWALIDSVLKDEAAPASERGGPPPELAEEYFDLQEAWAEGGKGDAKVTVQVTDFLSKISERSLGAEAEALALASRFPFKGFGDGAAPWTQVDLESLRRAVHKVRYYRSFERDIRGKFL